MAVRVITVPAQQHLASARLKLALLNLGFEKHSCTIHAEDSLLSKRHYGGQTNKRLIMWMMQDKPVRKAHRKVLFLLKEAYDEMKRPEGSDLREWMRNKIKPGQKIKRSKKAWNTLADWAYLIQKATNSRVPEIPQADDPERAEDLLACAVVNVKKCDGEKTSDMKKIKNWVESDGPFLKQQIDLIAPQIIVCGNTWKAVRVLWEGSYHQVYDRILQLGDRTVISFAHPANMFPKRLDYYALACLLQQAKCLS
jgi:hypothetical protein